MVLNCALVTYIMMTADVGLPDVVYYYYPRRDFMHGDHKQKDLYFNFCKKESVFNII